MPVGQLATNCYLVWDENSLETVIVDPGADGEYISQKILDNQLKPKLIVATHGHFDHVLAVNELKHTFKTPFLIHKAETSILKRARKMSVYFTHFDPGPVPEADGFLKANDEIELVGLKLRVIETPGHTPGGICLYTLKEGWLFSGDTIFADGGIGRTDLQEGNFEQLVDSIKNKIFILPGKTLLLSGHGEESTINKEKRNKAY